MLPTRIDSPDFGTELIKWSLKRVFLVVLDPATLSPTSKVTPDLEENRTRILLSGPQQQKMHWPSV